MYTPFSQETVDGVIKGGVREGGDEVGGVCEEEWRGNRSEKRELEIVVVWTSDEREFEGEKEEEGEVEREREEEGEVEETRKDEGKEEGERKEEVDSGGEEKEMVDEGREDEDGSKGVSSEAWIVD